MASSANIFSQVFVNFCFDQLKQAAISGNAPESFVRYAQNELQHDEMIKNYNRSHFPTKKIRTRRRETHYEDLWKQKKMNAGQPSQIDLLHNCYMEDCHSLGNISVISESDKIFQCETSGKVHICSQNGRCELMVSTDEGNVCYFSGECDMNPKVIESFEDAERGAISSLPVETQSTVLNQIGSLLPGPRLKKYGMPSARFIKASLKGGDEEKSDSDEKNKRRPRKTWTTTPKQPKAGGGNLPNFHGVFSHVLNLILFDQVKREEINRRNREEVIDKWFMNHSKTSQLMKVVNVIDVFNYTIHSTRSSELNVVKRTSTNKKKIDFYLKVCERLWKLACSGNVFRSSVPNDNKRFIIAFLYLLGDCQVKSSDGDTFITKNLPSQVDISHYWKRDFGKNYVVESKKRFKRAFQEISSEKASFTKFTLKQIVKEVKETTWAKAGSFDFISNFSNVVMDEG